MICQTNNENFYDIILLMNNIINLLYPTPARTSQSTDACNENGIGKVGIDIGSCDNNNDGLYIFLFLSL